MIPFKRTVAQLLRFSLKPRRPLRQPLQVPVTADNAAPYQEYDWLCEPVHAAPKSQLQPQTDVDVEKVTLDRGDEKDSKAVNVDVVVDWREGKDDNEDVDAVAVVNDRDIPRTFPFDLVKKTRLEMMIQHLYVAISDDDREIAALRTSFGEKFTHVVRISFHPPAVDDRLAPSAWTQNLRFANSTPFQLDLQCPTFALGLGERQTALTKLQLFVARKYITSSLPHRRDLWIEQGVKFPFTPEECDGSRLLIVGPTDRSADVMAVLVCYLTLLTGAPSSKLLDSVKKLDLAHPYWKNVMTNAVPRQTW